MLNRSVFFAPACLIGLVSVAPSATAATIYDLIAGGSNLAGYAVVGLPGINPIHLSSGPLNFTGNIAVGANGNFAFDGGGTVNGTLYADPSATITNSSTITGGVNLNGPRVSNVVSAASSLATLAASDAAHPTQIFASITGAQTITGNGALNVIDVTNNIALSGGNLTLSGGPNDLFIIDVMGSAGIQISGGTQFVLNGINPNQVLFYLPGTASNILQTSSGSNIVKGIFLAPNGGIQINGGTDTAEFIAGTQFTAQSNPVVTAPLPPTPTTEPGSILLAAIALISMAVFLKRQARRSSRLTL